MNDKSARSLLYQVLLLCAAAILCLLLHSISVFRYAVYIDEHIAHPLNSSGLSPSVMSRLQLSLIPAYLLMFIFGALASKRICNALGAAVSLYSLIASGLCFLAVLKFCIAGSVSVSSVYGSMTYWICECIKIVFTVVCALLSICIIRQQSSPENI